MAKFTEIFEDVTKKGVKIPSNLYLDTGLYPIIDQGQSAIAGYTNKADGLFFDVPAIIFGDHTRIFKYVEKPCFLGADGVKLLKAKKPNANHKYLYYALCNADIPNTGYNRHFKWLKEVDIPEYSEEEQEDIVLKLDKISHLIALRKRQLSKLDELVKSRFVEMFGDLVTNNKNWSFAPLGNVCDVRDGTHASPKYHAAGYPLMTSKNFTNGYEDFSDVKLISKEDFIEINRRSRVDLGDIVMPMIGTIGCPVIIKSNREFAIKNVSLIKFTSESPINIFVKVVLSSHYFKRIVQKTNRGNTQKFIALGDIRDFPFPLPPLALQREFAAFVEKVDKLEFKAKASLEKLETLKKAMMQKYFG